MSFWVPRPQTRILTQDPAVDGDTDVDFNTFAFDNVRDGDEISHLIYEITLGGATSHDQTIRVSRLVDGASGGSTRQLFSFNSGSSMTPVGLGQSLSSSTTNGAFFLGRSGVYSPPWRLPIIKEAMSYRSTFDTPDASSNVRVDLQALAPMAKGGGSLWRIHDTVTVAESLGLTGSTNTSTLVSQGAKEGALLLWVILEYLSGGDADPVFSMKLQDQDSGSTFRNMGAWDGSGLVDILPQSFGGGSNYQRNFIPNNVSINGLPFIVITENMRFRFVLDSGTATNSTVNVYAQTAEWMA